MERIHRGLTLIKMLNPTNEGDDLPIVSDRSGHGNLAGRYMHGAEYGWSSEKNSMLCPVK